MKRVEDIGRIYVH